MMMMMIGDPPQSNPAVHIPPWDYPDPTAHIHSPSSFHDSAALAALQRFLPSNKADEGVVRAEDDENPDSDFDFPADAFSCDNFRMFEFKVKKCARARSHDWTECPFAHPGEKARRRDPRRYHYSGSACPDYRRGACRRGDACEYAHGVFECWLHPARYRTQPCKDGTHCRRRICFFAHTPEQLRVLPYTSSPDGSPRRPEHDPFMVFGSSPKSTLFISPPSSPTASSPPVSPGESLKLSQLTETMRGLQLSKMQMGLGLGLSTSPPSWGLGFGSPRCTSKIRPGFMSLPSTPIRAVARQGLSPFDAFGISSGEEPAMERVESGKALRERIYAKIGQDNSLNWSDPDGTSPDVGWVSDLVK
ncbi:zinc finger CCCH domain-containing protein 20 [Phtheirospermum japonicum]|uniref:Zinc finger CCCH domain-containing protein 20 n=1 Tax=Phtheirospermum japonicum TaxID=374723 RepID=A0A830B5H7_9LAMI|nr:zinc finger CCCH domain-containing protein 20 [Phtheirospermum japonicum]